MRIAFLNGEYMDIDDCKVSVLDRGFTFGESVYEVLPVYKGEIFARHAHLQRLRKSLAKAKIADVYESEYLLKVFRELITKNNCVDCAIYLQITNGKSPREHAAPGDDSPTIFIMLNPLPPTSQKGVATITHEDFRWDRCDIKTTSLLANTMLKKLAHSAAVHEVILIRDNFVTEGASSNVFLCKDGELYTAPADNLILPGITRAVVIDIAKKHGFTVHEQKIPAESLFASDEVWLTSSLGEISSVTAINQHQVNNGKPGPLWESFSLWLSQQTRKESASH